MRLRGFIGLSGRSNMSIPKWRKWSGGAMMLLGGSLIAQHLLAYGYSSEPGPCHGTYGLIILIAGFLISRRYRKVESDDSWKDYERRLK